MIEFRKDKGCWFFNGKNINECNTEELEVGYREFYAGKSKEELQLSLGLALATENYVKCKVIKEIYGEEYLEPIPAKETITNFVKDYFNGTSRTS